MDFEEKIRKELEIDLKNTKEKIKEFIKRKTEKAGADGAVIGLSGGIDSTTITYLAAEALGEENVLGIFMPEKGVNDERDFEDVKKVVDDLGIDSETIFIDSLVKEFKKKTGAKSEEKLNLANVKARIRTVLLYYYANSENYLVIGSNNKSELKCGYFTKFGDGASDIVPMYSLYKTQVRKLAEDLGVPKSIIEKPPTAGLWEGQTDENELGLSYGKIDKIYKGLELDFEKEKIASAVDLDVSQVERFEKMEKKTEHKRKGPISLNLD